MVFLDSQCRLSTTQNGCITGGLVSVWVAENSKGVNEVLQITGGGVRRALATRRFSCTSSSRTAYSAVLFITNLEAEGWLGSRVVSVLESGCGLAESNGSQPPGLWLMSPAGSLPRTGISFGTLRSAVEYGLPFLPFTETVTAAEVPQSGSEWVEPSPLEGQKLHE